MGAFKLATSNLALSKLVSNFSISYSAFTKRMAALAFSKLSATIKAMGCPKKRTLLSYKTLKPLHSETFLGRSAAIGLYPGTAGQLA